MRIPLTVALLTYNRAHFLREAITGILAQTYRDFEFLILDNGSTDDTPSVVLSMRDERIRYVRNPPGHGPQFNGFSAVKIARGERIIVTHDDDVMRPTMLEKQMAMLDTHPGMTGVWTNTSTIDCHGNIIQEYFTPNGPDRIYKTGEFIAKFPSENLWPLPCTFMFIRKKYPQHKVDELYYDKDLGKQPPKTHGGDDVLLAALMNVQGSVSFLNEPLLKYRRHNSQDTNQTHLSIGILETYRTLRRFAGKLPDKAKAVLLLDASIARFTAQHDIIHTTVAQPTVAARVKLKRLLDKACRSFGPNSEADLQLLPLRIFLSQTSKYGDEIFQPLTVPKEDHPIATHALFHWACLRQAGMNLFAPIPEGSNIVIFGSALVSDLLVNEARLTKLNVLCCIDSNATRQGQTMLGTPIHPPKWLTFQGDAVDYVILSSERDQDAYLHAFILGLNKNVTSLSWKDLALDQQRWTNKFSLTRQ